MSQDEIISTYIGRLEALQHQREAQLTEAELHAVARELGLSEADLARAEEAAEAHLTRGRGFAQHKLYDDAIAELKAAATLRPLAIEPARALADAYAQRWRIGGATADRDEAARLARRWVELDPGDPAAFALISSLKHAPSQVHLFLPVMVVLLSMLVMAMVMIVLLAQRPPLP